MLIFLITTHDFLHYHAVKPYPTPFITPTPNAASSSASPQYPPRGEVVCFRAGYFVFVWLPPAIYAISRPTRIEITPPHAPQCAFLCKIFIFFIKYLHKKKKRPIFALALRHEALYDGAIAQLVEQRTENPCVPGSIPGGTTKKIANS